MKYQCFQHLYLWLSLENNLLSDFNPSQISHFKCFINSLVKFYFLEKNSLSLKSLWVCFSVNNKRISVVFYLKVSPPLVHTNRETQHWYQLLPSACTHARWLLIGWWMTKPSLMEETLTWCRGNNMEEKVWTLDTFRCFHSNSAFVGFLK